MRNLTLDESVRDFGILQESEVVMAPSLILFSMRVSPSNCVSHREHGSAAVEFGFWKQAESLTRLKPRKDLTKNHFLITSVLQQLISSSVVKKIVIFQNPIGPYLRAVVVLHCPSTVFCLIICTLSF